MSTKTKLRPRQELINTLLKLQRQIEANTTDQKLLSGLRADYREAQTELSQYYDDGSHNDE